MDFAFAVKKLTKLSETVRKIQILKTMIAAAGKYCDGKQAPERIAEPSPCV